MSSPIMITSTKSPTSVRNRRNQSSQNWSVLIEQRFAECWLFDHVHEPPFQPAEIPAGFVDHAADATDQGVGRVVADGERLLTQMCKPRRVVSLGEWKLGNIRDGGVSERVMGNVHIAWGIIGHGPSHAKLVHQVMPELAISRLRHDGAVKSRSSAGMNVTRIDCAVAARLPRWAAPIAARRP